MSNNNSPNLRQGPRNPQGLAPLVDDAGTKEMREDEKSEKKMLEAEVKEVPSEPVAVAVAWDGPNDPENPQNFTTRKKWTITAVICVLTINAYVFIFT